MELKLNTPCDKFEFLKNLFCGKNQQEIATALDDSIKSIGVITSNAEDGEFLFLLTLSSCVKIGCGTVFTDAKKSSVCDLFPDGLHGIPMKDPNLFFTPADESDFNSLRDLMKANDLLATYILKLIFAVAYTGDMTDNTAIEKAREILIASGIDPDVEYEVCEYEDSLEWDE